MDPFRADGSRDLGIRIDELADSLPDQLRPLASLAFNYRWSWLPGATDLFARLHPERWSRCAHNPVQLIRGLPYEALRDAAEDATVISETQRLAAELRTDLRRRPVRSDPAEERPIAFFCAEFGIHSSLPIYSGGLGILAGDLLKEASDRALPLVGVGLLYRQGYFRQRLDEAGRQVEYWTDLDTDDLALAEVHADDGSPVVASVDLRGRTVLLRVWRADIGRVPLFLLDAAHPGNARSDRWITARLYVSDRQTRLDQYAVLGIGGLRALRAMGLLPSIVHVNDGHATLSAAELIREAVDGGAPFAEALEATRSRMVFTTHTPVPAGNERLGCDEAAQRLPSNPAGLTADILELGEDRGDFGLTAFGIAASGSTNAVSAQHGTVARQMWGALSTRKYPPRRRIEHVTNGVHLPTWMAAPMRTLMDRYLGEGWMHRSADPRTWEGVDAIPTNELWETRCTMRSRFIEYVRAEALDQRLARGRPRADAEQASAQFDPDILTIGFGRRIATYKRLGLLAQDPHRALQLLIGERPVQVIIAGKAHPNDEEAKQVTNLLFSLREAVGSGGRVVFLENYDMDMAGQMIAGCDIWLNVPRPPHEASGTSGMKAALNGCLNLGVLDGWWAEGYDGANGWAIQIHPEAPAETQDRHDSAELYRLIEAEIAPRFYARDGVGVPRDWVAFIKRSIRSLAPRFCATRMIDDYVREVYDPLLRERVGGSGSRAQG